VFEEKVKTNKEMTKETKRKKNTAMHLVDVISSLLKEM
jgi:hypothetical protein